MRKRKKRSNNDRLVEDEFFTLSEKRGNGILRRQVWQDGSGEVTRYSLAYINPFYYSKDNGRVLGYDNAHGYHHRHYLGKVEPINFSSFLEIEERFQREFEVIHEEIRKKSTCSLYYKDSIYQ